jgi:hypothetical protein
MKLCSLVLVVGDVFEPVGGFAVEAFLDGDVGHGGGGGSAVPAFFAGGDPDDVAGADFFDGSAPAPDAAVARGDDEVLAEGVGVPGGACAGFEGDAGGGNAGRMGALTRGSMRTVPVKYSGDPLVEGWVPFFLISIFDVLR